LNQRKTRFQSTSNGLIHITGVALDGSLIRPTRATLRRIRAATHQNNQRQVRGLTEWAACRYPRLRRHVRARNLELNKTHPLNQIALECLDGYGADAEQELAVETLIRAYWSESDTKSALLARVGSRKGIVIARVLRFLSKSDPDKAMDFIDTNDFEAKLDPPKLRQLDGIDIAANVVIVVFSALKRNRS
jgi:hypothetical protein